MLGAWSCFWRVEDSSLALASFFFFVLSFFFFSAFSLILLLPGGKLSVLRIFWGRFCRMPESVNMFS